MTTLVVVEHDRGSIAPASLEAITAARTEALPVDVLVIGGDGDALATSLSPLGVGTIHHAQHDLLDDYGPEAWGEVVAQAVRELHPEMVIATGTDRGNEVLAQAAARLDLPFVANCIQLPAGGSVGGPRELTRVRWGGSLVETAALNTDTALVTIAHHHFDAAPAASSGDPAIRPLVVDLDPKLARTIITGRVEREAGVALSTAAVVVGGGRGVGSAEGFEALEELASLLGGVVGCSRAVTNNGWRNHADQVGQTGTRIAPDVYFACGISGAIQHWVGAMASKHIIAINTDDQANMVTKADYAVIANLHEVVPAIAAEIRRRQG